MGKAIKIVGIIFKALTATMALIFTATICVFGIVNWSIKDGAPVLAISSGVLFLVIIYEIWDSWKNPSRGGCC